MNSAQVELGAVADFINGVAFKPEDWKEAGKPIIRIQNLNDPTKPFNRTTRNVPDRNLARKGDLLVSWSASLGVFEWTGEEACINQHIFKVIPNHNKIDHAYLRRALESSVSAMEAQVHGATMKHINRDKFLGIRIPLPSLPEQRRIAAILDKADVLRAKRRAAIAKLDQLFQSVFLEMFGDPVMNPKDWTKVALSELTSKIGSGATPKGGNSVYQQEGISFIRSLNVHDGNFRYKNLAFINEVQAKKLVGVSVNADDVLLNITGASVARVCRVPNDVLPARVNQHVSIIRCAPGLMPSFLEHVLMSPSMKNILLRTAGSGATREAITKKQIEDLLVPVPPIEIQQKFSAAVQKIVEQGQHSMSAINRQEDLFASIQEAAFSGKL